MLAVLDSRRGACAGLVAGLMALFVASTASAQSAAASRR